jgi:hypothetical protein
VSRSSVIPPTRASNAFATICGDVFVVIGLLLR